MNTKERNGTIESFNHSNQIKNKTNFDNESNFNSPFFHDSEELKNRK